jgi:(1->4)-alpha-D-glucan 1-alpha-D-glucosylmutase
MGFGFDQAAGVADYLAQLGVSHLYTSPGLQAAPGSMHGYDTVDHARPSDDLGGPESYARLGQTLQRAGLGQLLDIVPNHMSITGSHNAWWQDVLENGQASPFASYFDIDWVAPEARLYGKILLPVLGDHFGRVLEAGQIQLQREGAVFGIRYLDHAFPLDFCTLGGVIAAAAERCGNPSLAFITDAMRIVPDSPGTPQPESSRCARDRDVLKAQLGRLLAEVPAVAQAIDDVISETNTNPDALDALLSRQHYRLAYWRTASQELNYRRFFDINTLIGLRVEEQPVFEATHSLLLRWLDEGNVHGLRVDHPDGLRDPEEYFERLAAAAPDAWILAEKILEPAERLRETWPIDGTTGYDFLNRAMGLFVNPDGEGAMTAFYGRFTGESMDYRDLAYRKKRMILQRTFGGELSRLTSLFVEICEQHRQFRDYTRVELRDALTETIACFPVYRTYVRPKKLMNAHPDDVRYVCEAISSASRRRPDIDRRLLKFLSDLLLVQVRGDTEGELVMRFQQLSGPAMAKAIEDTAFYNYNRLVCLNEVGGDPGQFGVSVEEFHRDCLRIQEDWPYTMTATSTHDTKRSEDVRARIALLSSIPDRWADSVQRWATINGRHRIDGMPDRNAEYLLYQTMVGAWPIDAQRLTDYMLKAAREAKAHTSWTDPVPAYEDAMKAFVSRILKDPAFIEDIETFVKPLVPLGRINSLAMTLLKFTAPGVPDIYQGTELWDLSLVDPDNRRPVDYDRRRRLLGELDSLSPQDILARADEGLPKLWLTRQALHLRRRRPSVFADGEYQPLEARGDGAKHVVAFSRAGQVVTVVPRLVIPLQNDWGDTWLELPPGAWHNELTGERLEQGNISVATLLDRFPVALLDREPT